MASIKVKVDSLIIDKATQFIDSVYDPLFELSKEKKVVRTTWIFGFMSTETTEFNNSEALEDFFESNDVFGLAYDDMMEYKAIYTRRWFDFVEFLSSIDEVDNTVDLTLTDTEYEAYLAFKEYNVKRMAKKVRKLYKACKGSDKEA